MSDLVFPSSLNGYAWDSKKKPVFYNLRHTPVTGREVRISLYSQPMYEFSLVNNWLTKADKDTLIGFFLARQGGFDSFLYVDEDSSITAQVFGVGDGTETAFQLVKTTGTATDKVNHAAALPAIYVDNVLKTAGDDYSINGAGLVTMTAAPANGSILKWTGTAYYRCVFTEDAQEYSQFADRLYECGEILFKGSMAAKL